MQFTKKDSSPNHFCLHKMFSVSECKFQLSNAVHGVALSVSSLKCSLDHGFDTETWECLVDIFLKVYRRRLHLNNNTYYSNFIHCTNSDFLIG